MRGPAERLRAAQITGKALATTLPKMGHQDLRDIIEEGSLEYTYVMEGEDKLGLKGMIFYCKEHDYPQVRLASEVFAKELVLFGYTRIQTTTLSKMLDAIEHHDDWYLDGFRGHTIIREFYVADSMTPFEGRLKQRLQSLLMGLMDEGNAFTFVGACDRPPQHWDWYDQPFLEAIAIDCIVVGL